MLAGTYTNEGRHGLYKIGTILRVVDGTRYKSVLTSHNLKKWVLLPEKGDIFDNGKTYFIEHVPSEVPEYAFNKTQRKILKWLGSLTNVETGRLLGQLTQYKVFHKSSNAEVKVAFETALRNSGYYYAPDKLTDADMESAEAIFKKAKQSKCTHKVGDILDKTQLLDLPPGSLYRFNNVKFNRMVVENGKFQKSNGPKEIFSSAYYFDNDKLIVVYINE